MTAYRKKPVVIEATQWFKDGDHENDTLRELLRQTIVYLDARVGNKPESRGYALLQRLNAALIRKD